MRSHDPFGTCRNCGCQIMWVKTKAGKNMPVDPTMISYRRPGAGVKAKEKIVTPEGEVVCANKVSSESEATRNASYGYNDTTEGNYEDNSAETFAPVSSEVPVSTPQTGPISVNVAVSPNFQIEAKEGQSEEDIVAVIRRHLGEIADELGGNIADKLSEVFANMPVTSTKGA